LAGFLFLLLEETRQKGKPLLNAAKAFRCVGHGATYKP
jgi:hypothetical protein